MSEVEWTYDPDNWPHTPPLDEWIAMYAKDDNLWWRQASGHGQNIVEALIDRLGTIEADLRERIAAEIETSGLGDPYIYGLRAAARIARGKEKPAPLNVDKPLYDYVDEHKSEIESLGKEKP